MRIAEQLAEKEQCWGLVTGDSLGQVASQTAENLQTVSQVTHLPILRPLIGMDKIEITNEAQQIGTFETSIEPDQDCCTLFVPRHPNTRCRLDALFNKLKMRWPSKEWSGKGWKPPNSPNFLFMLPRGLLGYAFG